MKSYTAVSSVTSVPLANGTVKIIPEVDIVNNANQHVAGHYGLVYEGNDALNMRWLQFISREITITDPNGQNAQRVDTYVTSTGGSYPSTTDPQHPNYNLDVSPEQFRGAITEKPATPYYAELYEVGKHPRGYGYQTQLTSTLTTQQGNNLAVLHGSGLIDQNISAMFDRPSWNSSATDRIAHETLQNANHPELYAQAGTTVENKAHVESFLIDTRTGQPVYQVSLNATSASRITDIYDQRKMRCNEQQTQPLTITVSGHQACNALPAEFINTLQQQSSKLSQPLPNGLIPSVTNAQPPVQQTSVLNANNPPPNNPQPTTNNPTHPLPFQTTNVHFTGANLTPSVQVTQNQQNITTPTLDGKN